MSWVSGPGGPGEGVANPLMVLWSGWTGCPQILFFERAFFGILFIFSNLPRPSQTSRTINRLESLSRRTRTVMVRVPRSRMPEKPCYKSVLRIVRKQNHR